MVYAQLYWKFLRLFQYNINIETHCNISNYRPVTLLPIFGKGIWKTLQCNIHSFLDIYNFFLNVNTVLDKRSQQQTEISERVWIEKQRTANLCSHTRRRSWWGCWQCCADESWWSHQARPCAESSWTQSSKSLESTGTWDWQQPCPTVGRTVEHLALQQVCKRCAVPQSLLLS